MKFKKKIVVSILAVFSLFVLIGAMYNPAPQLNIDGVQSNATVRTDDGKYVIKGNIEYAEGATLTINGTFVEVDANGNYQYVASLKEGDNEFTIVVSNEHGTDTKKIVIHRTTAAELAERAQKERAAKEAKEKTKTQTSSSQKSNEAQRSNPTGNFYRVVGIVDGDTIKVSINGKTETVRLIGVDTPETKDPRKPVQCYGPQATSRMQHYVQSKNVRLESDPSQGDRDKYGRLLRYVHLQDGRNVGYHMILDGAAHEYTYNKPYKYQKLFKEAERIAKQKKVGLWSPKTCNGNTNQQKTSSKSSSSSTKKSTQQSTKKTTKPKTTTPKPSSGSSVYYKNCTEARNAGAAPIYKGQPGYGTHLDRDKDGIACE